eukprot:5888473-Prymnesium_polylepis.1
MESLVVCERSPNQRQTNVCGSLSMLACAHHHQTYTDSVAAHSLDCASRPSAHPPGTPKALGALRSQS